MKSSSRLFPVTLLRADMMGPLAEDTYLIRHGRDSDPSVQIAVSRLMLSDEKPDVRGFPIVLVHGSFCNRGFWISS
ncbi:MAG: hypothetical protein P1U57_07970, partial [Oleibacter sp.]|nr:hypothetical protein [Thalassolituus sp.]